MRIFSVLCHIAAMTIAVSSGAAADQLPSGSEAAFEPKLEPWLDWDPTGSSVSLIEPLRRTIPISSPFGPRWLFGRAHPFHAGIDFAAHAGTPVEAAADGWVAHAGPAGSYGNMIELSHGDGIVTRYAHLSRILVVVGGRVRQGQEIGLSGSTGRSTGAHLHYEVHQNGSPIDPWNFPGSHLFEAPGTAHFVGSVPRWDSWSSTAPDRLPAAGLARPDDQVSETATSRAASRAR